VAGTERQSRGNFCQGEVLCHGKRGPMSQSRMPRYAKTLGQGTCVNVDRTGRGAKTIYRAGVQDHVGEIAIESSPHLEIVGLLT
jgi:hypothetical protein